jgi:hypothetical protein
MQMCVAVSKAVQHLVFLTPKEANLQVVVSVVHCAMLPGYLHKRERAE